MKKFLKSTRFWQVISVILFIAVIGSGGNNNAQELTDLKENLEILQEENEELQSSYADATNEIAEVKNQNQTLLMQLDVKENEIESLSKDSETVLKYEEQIAELESQNKSLTDENTTLQSRISDYEKNNNSLSSSTSEGVTGSGSSSASIEQPSGNSEPSGGTIVYITNTGSKYHRGSCSYLRKSKIEIDKAAAIAQGYGACSRCNP